MLPCVTLFNPTIPTKQLLWRYYVFVKRVFVCLCVFYVCSRVCVLIKKPPLFPGDKD